MYFDVASHLISEVATGYDAYEFFNSKEKIAQALQVTLNTYFTKHLHATVVSLQIQSCRLPDEFNQVRWEGSFFVVAVVVLGCASGITRFAGLWLLSRPSRTR